MTAADTGPGSSVGVVRPLKASLVRPDWAARAVVPMVDGLEEGDRHRSPVPPTAYEDSPPAFYAYRIRHGTRDHLGLVADVRVDAFASGGIRGHEAVDPRRVDALVRHYSKTPAHSEPVALLHPFGPGVKQVLERTCDNPPLLHFPGPDGSEHTVWRVAGEDEEVRLAEALDQAVQYVADGHHRVAARLRVWELAGRPADDGILCVIFAMDGLQLSAFHRRVTGPVDAAQLLDAATAHFAVRRVSTAGEVNGVGLYVAGQWHDLADAHARPDGSAGLDVAVLHSRVLGPALGIAPDMAGAGHARLEVVPAHAPIHQAAAQCDQDGGALFVLNPPPLGTLMAMADRGEVLPPKTTYFSPKPSRGIFLISALSR